MIRVILPAHLKQLAHVNGEISLEVTSPPTQASLLDALEANYPMLLGTIRNPRTRERRAYVRFFASERDLSHDGPDAILPNAVQLGLVPFVVIGAMAGG